MLVALLLLAAEPEPDGLTSLLRMLPMMFAIFMLGYFLLLRPAQRQEQQRRLLINALKKNDKIVNSGGIIGVVESIKEKDDEVVLKGGLRITKSSIVRLVAPEESVKEQKE